MQVQVRQVSNAFSELFAQIRSSGRLRQKNGYEAALFQHQSLSKTERKFVIGSIYEIRKNQIKHLILSQQNQL